MSQLTRIVIIAVLLLPGISQTKIENSLDAATRNKVRDFKTACGASKGKKTKLRNLVTALEKQFEIVPQNKVDSLLFDKSLAGQWFTLVTPFMSSEDAPFNKVATKCWAHLHEFLNKSPTSGTKKFAKKWRSCLLDQYRKSGLPKPAKMILACLSK